MIILFTDYIDRFRKRISGRDYKGIFFSCMGLLLMAATAVLVLWAAIVVFAQLIHVVADNILYIAGFLLLGLWGTIYIKGKMRDNHDRMEEQRTKEQFENELAHQSIGESTYLTARQAMYSILASIAPSCGLQTPEGLSSIEAPRHFISRDEILIFQFVVVKRGEVNIRTITSLIETRIQQMANAHELNFEPSTLVILGQVYSAIMVDQIHDYGSYVQIDIVFTAERYIKNRIERDHQNRQPPFTGGGNDHDF